MTRTAIIATLALLCALPSLAEVTLVRDGAPVAQIVMPDDADETVALTAEELNLHLEMMSGAELPVVTEPAAGTPSVYLGAPDNAWAEEADSDGHLSLASRDRQGQKRLGRFSIKHRL